MCFSSWAVPCKLSNSTAFDCMLSIHPGRRLGKEADKLCQSCRCRDWMKATWCCCLRTWNSRGDVACIIPLLYQSVPIKWFTLRYWGTGAELKGESRLLFFNPAHQDKSLSVLLSFYTWNKLIIHIYTNTQYIYMPYMISCHAVTCLVALRCRALFLPDLEHPVWLQLWTSQWIYRNQEWWKSWWGFHEITGSLSKRKTVVLQ